MTAYRGGDATKPIPCGTCGTFIDPRSATYSLDGTLACPRCASSHQIHAAEVRGSQGVSFNKAWVRVAVIAVLVLLRLLLRLH
jgi:hypothetical protein